MAKRTRRDESMPPSAFFRKAKLYADADVETEIVEFIRAEGVSIVSAHDYGYGSRDDEFQLAEATRQRRFLLTKNGRHFLDESRFPLRALKYGIFVLEGSMASTERYALTVLHVLKGLIPYGGWFEGTKVVVMPEHIAVWYRGDPDGRLTIARFAMTPNGFIEVAE